MVIPKKKCSVSFQINSFFGNTKKKVVNEFSNNEQKNKARIHWAHNAFFPAACSTAITN